jgi:hypothetical protein
MKPIDRGTWLALIAMGIAVFANAGTAPVSNTSTFSAGSDEFPQSAESLCI